jgi:hypothetical protein
MAWHSGTVSNGYIFNNWCSEMTNSTSDNTWQIWAGSTTSSGTITCSTTNDTWNSWIRIGSSRIISPERRVLTAEEIRAEEVARAEAQEALRRRSIAMEAEARVREEKAREAAARAETLLLSILSERQREELHRDKAFVVEGRHARYRIRRGWSGNVDVIGRDGRIQRRLCAHPVIHVPNADNMAAQKLMLETNEDEFLRIANPMHWDIPPHPVLPAMLH